MKKLLVYTLLFGSCAALWGAAVPRSATFEWKITPSCKIVSSEVDPLLDQQHARFEIHFGQELLNRQDVKYPLTIEYSCNGVIRRLALDSTMKTTVDVSPGTYQFMLAVDQHPQFTEIVTGSIAIAPAHKTVLEVYFMYVDPTPVNSGIKPIPNPGTYVYKPVIYTYAEKDRDVSVTVQPKGDFTYTYPEHGNGWKGTAHPDGSMTIAGKTYPYLFWEGEQQELLQLADYSTGFVVEKKEVTAFLEEKLAEMGLNDKEQTDFITFWGPRMAQSERGFVQFLFTSDYDNIATLDVQPQPDNRFRVYLLWTPLANGLELYPKPQKMERVNRSGFTVIEWGGSELPVMEPLCTVTDCN